MNRPMRRIFGDNSSGSVDWNLGFDDGFSSDFQSLLQQWTLRRTSSAFAPSASQNSNSSLSASAGSHSSSDAPGQLVLLDDDGEISPATEASSGSQASLSIATGSTAPAPTLVGAAGGLQFNLIWDSSVGSAPSGFVSAVVTAATLYTQVFTNHQVINVSVGYGEVDGQTIGAGGLAASMSYGYMETYAQVSAALRQDASSSTAQAAADSTLPAGDPTNGGSFFVTTAEAKALGQVSGSGSSIDGYIGLSSSYPFSFTGTPNSSQYDAIGAFEHELSEVMGRMGSVGSLFGSNVYTPLDMFRYSAPGVRALVAGQGYFSIDNGQTNLGTYNNPLNGGDASDWTPSLAGDSYGSGYRGLTAAVSQTDLIEDSVLGYLFVPQNHAPVVTAADYSSARYQNIAVTSLFRVTDADNDTITAYQFWDSTTDPASGHFVVAGMAQGTGQNINVSPAQLSQTTFQAALVSDDLWVRAYDGKLWSTWTEFHVIPLDHTPVVTAPDYSATRGQNIAATSLFSVSDADNDTITIYQAWDSTADPSSGHWVVGGIAQPAGQTINVTPAQLVSATFQSASGSDDLWVRANDGVAWGAWREFHVNAPVDHLPVVMAPDYAAHHNQTIAATSLFSVSDGDGDPITAYQFWDSAGNAAGGHWVVGGAAQPVGQAIDVTPAQLASATFQSGSGSDHLWVRASDGIAWGAWQGFYLNAPIDHAPVVSGSDTSLALNTTRAASSLFSVTDADGDAMKTYELWDSVNPASNAHFLLNGAMQPSGQGIFVDASLLNQTSFVAASSPTTDLIWERAFDGTMWGDWFAVNVTSHA